MAAAARASLAFTVAGAAMIRGGETKGWFVVAMFALSTLVSGALLLPGGAGGTSGRRSKSAS